MSIAPCTDSPAAAAEVTAPGQFWRTGCEGRISHLKHGYSLDRTLLDGIGGAQTWIGLGILAHNCVKVSGLIAAKETPKPPPAPRPQKLKHGGGKPPPGPPPTAPLFN